MKKTLSLILSIVMLLCLSVSAFAASTTYTWTLSTAASYDGTGTVGILNPGDTFYLLVKSNAGYKGLSLLLDIDTSVFDVALYEGSDDVADNGNYQVAAVMSPSGMSNKMSFTAITAAGRPAAVNSYIGLTVKSGVTTGTYNIGVSSAQNGVFNAAAVQNNDSNNVGNTVSVSVKGIAAKDETITTGDATTGTDTKTWNVTVGKDFTGTTLKATLTNSAAAEGNQTQDVTLTLPADISGDASFVFDVNVKFQDFANAATTTLAVSAN